MQRGIAIAIVGWTTATASAQTSLEAKLSPSKDESGSLGVMADVGVPDGATASLVLRPTRSLRLELGAADNLVSPGVRGGVTWIPLASWATPTIGVSYGKFFERDANPVAQQLAGDMSFSSPLLDKVGYDYASARVGIELGKKYFTFFLHAGVSRVTGDVHGLNEVANSETSNNSNISITTTDPKVTLWGVSANLGFIFYVH